MDGDHIPAIHPGPAGRPGAAGEDFRRRPHRAGARIGRQAGIAKHRLRHRPRDPCQRVAGKGLAGVELHGIGIESRRTTRAGFAGTRFRVLDHGKPIEGLETAEQQFSVLAGLPLPEQKRFLLMTLAEAERIVVLIDELALQQKRNVSVEIGAQALRQLEAERSADNG